VAEIPDDVVNFFNNSQPSADRRVNDDDDVGLLQLDSDAADEDGPTSGSRVNPK